MYLNYYVIDGRELGLTNGDGICEVGEMVVVKA